MFAHVDPILLFGFLGCLVFGNLAALVAGIGSFASHRRRLWLLATAWLAVVLGLSATGIYLDDSGGWDWMLTLCVAPVLVGVISLIRLRSINA